MARALKSVALMGRLRLRTTSADARTSSASSAESMVMLTMWLGSVGGACALGGGAGRVL